MSANRNVIVLVPSMKHPKHVSHQTNRVFPKTYIVPLNKMHGWYLKETYFFSLAIYVLNIIDMFLLQWQSYRDRSECVLSKPGLKP